MRSGATNASSEVTEDLRELLAEPLSEAELREKVLGEYSLFYDPWREEITMREWLEGLLKEMQSHRDVE